MTKIMISAGEASGDVHAAALTKEILKIDPTAQVYGMGGDGLRAAGGEVLFDIKDHGVMGLVELTDKVQHADAVEIVQEEIEYQDIHVPREDHVDRVTPGKNARQKTDIFQGLKDRLDAFCVGDVVARDQ